MLRPKVGRLNGSDIQRSMEPESNSDVQQIQRLIDDANESVDNIEWKKIDITVGNPWVDLTVSVGTGFISYCKLYDGSVQIAFSYFGGSMVGPPAAWTQAAVATLPESCRPHLAITDACADAYYATVAGFSGQYFISTAGVIGFQGTQAVSGRIRFMPSSNAPVAMSCFPVNVKTRFKTPPRAVVAVRSSRGNKDSKAVVSAPLVPFWRFINTSQGSTVQILNIQGLEYDSKQKIDIVIIGE